MQDERRVLRLLSGRRVSDGWRVLFGTQKAKLKEHQARISEPLQGTTLRRLFSLYFRSASLLSLDFVAIGERFVHRYFIHVFEV